MATGLLLYKQIARHGHSIDRLTREMIEEDDKDDLTHFLAYDAANYVYAFLAANGNRVSAQDRALRNDLMEALVAILEQHGINQATFRIWPANHAA